MVTREALATAHAEIAMTEPDGGETAKAAGARAQARDSMMMSATIRRAGSDAPALPMRVRNISSGGLMGEVDLVLAAGESVELSLKTVGQIQGTVAWADDGRIGIAFAVPVDRLRARRSIPVTPARPAPGQQQARRPGLRTA